MLSYHGDVNGRDLEPHLRRWLRIEGGLRQRRSYVQSGGVQGSAAGA
jgi:hypothetical protein